MACPTAADRLRPMVHDDLALVLAWRNHADVRRYMYTQDEIGLEQHRAWFDSALLNDRRQLFVFEADGQALGTVNFTRPAAGTVADWGFYAAPDAPRGTGRRLGSSALAHAFGDLGLHKVSGEVLSFNERSLRLHAALGFCREGVLRDQHFDGRRYHDVVCFGLLKREWQAHFQK